MKQIFNDLSKSYINKNSLGLATAKPYKDTLSLPFRAEDGIKKPFQKSANPHQNNQPALQKDTTFDTMATIGLINTEVTSMNTGVFGALEQEAPDIVHQHAAPIP